MIDPASVTVVSTRDVVSDAAVTVAVAFACTRVPDGAPALSVSILSFRSTHGVAYFLRAALSVVPATPLPNSA